MKNHWYDESKIMFPLGIVVGILIFLIINGILKGWDCIA